MIIVRMVFQASYGKGGELATASAAAMKQVVAASGGDHRWRVMTDLSGPFDTVVQEIEVASLAEWESIRTGLFSAVEFREALAAVMAATHALTVSGSTEYWTVEAAG
jgi:hypothetical protein